MIGFIYFLWLLIMAFVFVFPGNFYEGTRRFMYRKRRQKPLYWGNYSLEAIIYHIWFAVAMPPWAFGVAWVFATDYIKSDIVRVILCIFLTAIFVGGYVAGNKIADKIEPDYEEPYERNDFDDDFWGGI